MKNQIKDWFLDQRNWRFHFHFARYHGKELWLKIGFEHDQLWRYVIVGAQVRFLDFYLAAYAEKPMRKKP